MANSTLQNIAGAAFITKTDGKHTGIVFWSIVDLKGNHCEGSTLDEFFGSIIANHITNIYIHDFSYVCSYLIDYIMSNNWTYNKDGRFDWGKDSDCAYSLFRNDLGALYYLKLFFRTVLGRCSCEIKSSRNKTMSSLRDIYRHFELNIDTSVDIDKLQDNTIQLYKKDLNQKVIEQTIVSAAIVAGVIKELKKVGYNKLTIGSDSIKQWIKLDGDYSYMMPHLDSVAEDNIRYAYRGGFTWINPKYEGVVVNDGIVLDINSLYPYVMRNYELPYGQPNYVTSYQDCNGYFIAHIKVTGYLKDNKVPCISNMMNSNPDSSSIICNEYQEVLNNFDCWLTNYDFELLVNMYEITKIKFIEGYTFRTCNGIFNNFIDTNYEIKRTSSGAKRQISKLMLDSLYGRFGIKTDRFTSLPVYDGKVVSYENGDKLLDKTLRYLPIAVFITSIARYIIITAAVECIDRLIYVDTDSLHLVGTDIPECCPISKDLGEYKIEAEFVKAKYIGLKTYIHDEHTERGIETVVKMAGAPEAVRNQVTWDNFVQDAEFNGKTIVKTIPGGTIRIVTKYTITNAV